MFGSLSRSRAFLSFLWAALAATAPRRSSPDTNVAGAMLRPTEALALWWRESLMDWMGGGGVDAGIGARGRGENWRLGGIGRENGLLG